MVVVNILFRINSANHFCNKDGRRKLRSPACRGDEIPQSGNRRRKTEDPRLTADAVSRAGKTEDRRKLAVAVGSWQLAVGSWQLAKSIILLP